MRVTYLDLTPHDPIVARDGRPFGINQGRRMRGLSWPLPSVVAGSFRTALVKSHQALDFEGTMPQRLMAVEVSGVFPSANEELYLPAPNDCVWDCENEVIHRARPFPVVDGGCDFKAPGLQPVLFSDVPKEEDFKPAAVPAWWPAGQMSSWLVGEDVKCFDQRFLENPVQEYRDHVQLEANTGAAEEGKIFTTAGLNTSYLPRHNVTSGSFREKYAEVTLSARVRSEDAELDPSSMSLWHPLGGERRLVHWQPGEATNQWQCPVKVKTTLQSATRVRMVLATPAIFKDGWKPGWLSDDLSGEWNGTKLKLVGVSNSRWRAVSGWSLAPPRGPKPIRRMVPAGSVYFFEVDKPGDAASLADAWLESVSDGEQERRDGFGLAVWGTW